MSSPAGAGECYQHPLDPECLPSTNALYLIALAILWATSLPYLAAVWRLKSKRRFAHGFGYDAVPTIVTEILHDQESPQLVGSPVDDIDLAPEEWVVPEASTDTQPDNELDTSATYGYWIGMLLLLLAVVVDFQWSWVSFFHLYLRNDDGGSSDDSGAGYYGLLQTVASALGPFLPLLYSLSVTLLFHVARQPEPSGPAYRQEHIKASIRPLLISLFLNGVFSVSILWLERTRLAPAHNTNAISQFVYVLVVAELALKALWTVDALWVIIGTKVRDVYMYDPKDRKRFQSLEATAGMLSRYTFAWFNPIMKQGSERTVEASDIWALRPAETIDDVMAEYSRIRLTNRLHATASYDFMEAPNEDEELDDDAPVPFFSIMWKIVRKQLITQFLFIVGSSILFFAGPFFLNRILNCLQNGNCPDWLPFFYVGTLFAFTVIRILLDSRAQLIARQVGIRLRNVLTGLVYQKALHRVPRMSVDDVTGKTSAATTVGKIVNLLAVDASKIGDYLGFVSMPIIAAIQLVVCVVALYQLLGWSSLAGLGAMVVLMCGGAPITYYFKNIMTTLMNSNDVRSNAVNEMLQGIRIIKFFAWEKQFEDKITALRENEMRNRWKLGVMNILYRVVWYSAPLSVSLVTFIAFTKIAGQELTATIAFTALSLFKLLQIPLQQLPDMIILLMDSWVSWKRIRDFLGEEELEKYRSEFDPDHSHGHERPSIALRHDARFTWRPLGAPASQSAGPGSAAAATTASKWFGIKEFWNRLRGVVAAPVTASPPCFELVDINIEFPHDKLSVVCGPTGCGKTSTILALLGEMHRVHGVRKLPAQTPVAYVAQQAWLMNATIRDNITFGEPWDAEKYRRVIHACSLVKDFEILEGGDMTEVGEKGINLSGGQKQRIALARAAYSSSPVIVMDDPLSAVDAPTARHLYLHCIMGLLRGRTRILVTNAIGLAIPGADHVVILNEGRVEIQGTVEQILSHIPSQANPFLDSLLELKTAVLSEREAWLAFQYTEHRFESPAETLDTISADKERQTKSKLTNEEEVAIGKVDYSVYKLYFRVSGGYVVFAILMLGYFANQASGVFQDVWVRWWSEAYTNESFSALSSAASALPVPFLDMDESSHALSSFLSRAQAFVLSNRATITSASASLASVGSFRPIENLDFYLIGYFLIGVTTMFAITCRLALHYWAQIKASRTLHHLLLLRILKAPIRFFEVTPIGRILNRFTKDMVSVDVELSLWTGGVMFYVVYLFCVLVAVGLAIPSIFISLIPIVYIYYKIAKYYIRTSRCLKRLDSVSKSPIMSYFSETLSGVSTIRSFRSEVRFSKEFSSRVEAFNRANYFLAISNLWLAVRIQGVAALIVLAVGVSVLSAGLDASLVGLCLNFALTVTDALTNLVRAQAGLEMSMNSLERLQEYMVIDQEAPAIIPNNRTSPSWPEHGAVSIQHLVMKYAVDGPPVLDDINLMISAKEKVGIVGRTGAGKSTLSLAFFRFMEPVSGTIVIDGVDIRKIGLADLRSSLTIIPQDPVLFAGTIRTNLDPFSTLTDDVLWEALKRAHLVDPESAHGSRVQSPVPTDAPEPEAKFNFSLDTTITEGGGNISQGQRQLLCLARALAKKSRIVILDEATASVDTETDRRIQETIRAELSDATILTIAHRLRTVMDYDKILVLDHGKVKEWGTPLELIERKGGSVFRSMCEETGELNELIEIAQRQRFN
ncbi:uncharacterized protein BJ171DRAFT_445485 [Polychytrium aggregatum]|uniref:uncharacterized protein n=1 Tax=Polychytrium aggregatum TaxID=110093 RepID=UPI0022FEA3DB|nr:uncharacterized protein BJ171DRAFT_445485 [Polychytrium aggregatum]KAI9199470.1 hypothetical protein BJ171DRAFT_445485 [Polychytrium aggregatum]